MSRFQLSPNFYLDEFFASCPYYLEKYKHFILAWRVDKYLIMSLQQLRNEFAKPIKITSGVRDIKANKEAGGKSMSLHLLWKAVDFVVDGVHPKEVQEYIVKHQDKYLEIKGMGKSSVFTHIDTRFSNKLITWEYA